MDNGFTVVPLLGGALIPSVAVTNPMLADVRLTQNGLVDQPLPPFPLVAGKTAMLRGTLASAPASRSRSRPRTSMSCARTPGSSSPPCRATLSPPTTARSSPRLLSAPTCTSSSPAGASPRRATASSTASPRAASASRMLRSRAYRSGERRRLNGACRLRRRPLRQPL